MKHRKLKIPVAFFVILFALANIVTYNHAYKFTHFDGEAGNRIRPEQLSLLEKVHILFTGIENAKPVNLAYPKKPYETIKLNSYEEIEGWLIEKPEHKGIVILYHGYFASKSASLGYSQELNTLGYTTFLIDFMGSGGSSGNQTTVGFKEGRDVKESFDYIKKKYPQDEVILLGSSMGAAAIMRSVVDYDIKPDKVILECPFGSMKRTVEQRFEAMGLPSFILADMLMFYGGIQNDFNAFEHNPVAYAKLLNMPCLLLYGQKDDRVTRQETNAIFKNLNGEKKLHVFEDSGHGNYLKNSREEWLKVISGFLR